MLHISANDLKTKGISAIEAMLADHDEAIVSVLSSKMTQQEILEDFPELESDDIWAVLAFAADREHKVYSLAAQ